ncbi:Aste57867_22227 [Aphanomyces stellatus]|uniref:oligopeptidase A n=1 Tax=Aphanomyces stellatus TaxID=120398 RepID=A0A485LPJ2_9STRA|nr:hypothetical protein As57867_022158 [Aphanomyces stellatus]VFT98894.1 Aste57867_22227 [Aphanomyces stellatus]
MVNPLTRCVQDYALPPYATMRPEDIAPAIRAAIDEYAVDLAAIEDDLTDPSADLTWESVMDRLEIIDDPVDRLWQVVDLMSRVADSSELRAAEAELQAHVSVIQIRRVQSPAIYHAMTILRASPAYEEAYTTEQRRILDTQLLKAKLTGVKLIANDKDRFNDMHLRLATLKTDFANVVLDATKTFSLLVHEAQTLDGVPASARSFYAQNAVAAGYADASAATGPWKLSLERPAYKPIMKHCTNRALREELYRAFASLAGSQPHDNTDTIHEILRLRHDQARLLGFGSFADMSLATKMAPSVAAVQDMLDDLRAKCYPVAESELARLQAYAASHGQSAPLELWDVEFWKERLRQDEYKIDDEVIMQYFPLARVLAGMFELILQLFGIRIEAADGAVDTWHPDVCFFQMRAMDLPETPILGYFYLDAYVRPETKRHGALITRIASRSKILRTTAGPRLPVFSILCNQTPPVGHTPSLMSILEVEQLFHNFGDVLQHTLTASDYSACTSSSTAPTDVMEVVPLFLISMCYDPMTIKLISGHYETGEPLPDAVFDTLIASRKYMAATEMLRQLNMAAVDLALHHTYDPHAKATTAFDVQHGLAKRFCVLPPLANDRFLCSLSHIFSYDYAAGLYSYMWSDVLASDMFAKFQEAKTNDEWEATGRRFRDTILANLRIDEPLAVFESFRGRKPCSEPLLQKFGLKSV